VLLSKQQQSRQDEPLDVGQVLAAAHIVLHASAVLSAPVVVDSSGNEHLISPAIEQSQQQHHHPSSAVALASRSASCFRDSPGVGGGPTSAAAVHLLPVEQSDAATSMEDVMPLETTAIVQQSTATNQPHPQHVSSTSSATTTQHVAATSSSGRQKKRRQDLSADPSTVEFPPPPQFTPSGLAPLHVSSTHTAAITHHAHDVCRVCLVRACVSTGCVS
jgi:hypothetical protein